MARVYLGADHAGFELKEALEAALGELGHEAVDLGTHDRERVDYPDFGHRMAEAVLADPGSLGVLVCGSGIGVSIAANRHAGIRAALCHEAYSAAMSRRHNDANVLCMGSRVVGEGLARSVLEAFLGATFEGGRHAGRVEKIEIGERPMKLVLGETFRAEERRYDLRWNCEHCTRFDPEGPRCAHGYPIATHRRGDKPTETLTFCKEFEAQ